MKRSQQNKRDPTGSQRKINEYERALVRLFTRYTLRVLSDLETTNTRALEVAKRQPLKITLKDYNEHLDRIEKEELTEPAKTAGRNSIKAAYNAGNVYGSIQLGMDPEARKDEWKRIAALVDQNDAAFKKISDETSGKIRSVIGDGIINEKTFGEIVGDIKAAGDVGASRARVMARTEIMKAVNTGVHDRYAAAGVEKEEWLTALDEHTCDECEGNDGKIIPDDIEDRPPAHPNCRCTIKPVIEIPGKEAN